VKFLLTLVLLFVVFLLLIRTFENRIVFVPFKYPQGYWHPEAFGLELADCTFEAADGVTLHGWYLQQDSAAATLLWCHGNAGNISDRLDNMARLAKLPLNIFIFDYRGYGKSQGSPNEQGVYLDAVAAYDYLTGEKGVNPSGLFIFGRSLGGAVAVDLAAKRDCAGLILESTFSSGTDMARSMFGFIPVHLVTQIKFDSISKIRNIHVPILFLHGTRDRTVPFKLGKKLFEAANEPKEFYEIAGADHNDTYVVGGQAYFERFRKFVAALQVDGV